MKRSLIFFVAILIVILPIMSSCGKEEEVVPPTVIISPSEVQMSVGDIYTLDSTVFPMIYQDLNVSWYVSDPEIIECVGGRVYAKGLGTALVYAAAGSSRHSCRITVTEQQRKMIVGEEAQLPALQNNLIKGATGFAVYSGDEPSDVLSFENNVITANKKGDARIVATFENGDVLTVANISVRDITLTCNGMPESEEDPPLRVVVDNESGIAIEVYDLVLEKYYYSTDNYAVRFSFKYRLAPEVQGETVRVNFRVTLYSSEVKGEYCRDKDVSGKMTPGTEYQYVDSGFYAMLNEEGDRAFWIEIVSLEADK